MDSVPCTDACDIATPVASIAFLYCRPLSSFPSVPAKYTSAVVFASGFVFVVVVVVVFLLLVVVSVLRLFASRAKHLATFAAEPPGDSASGRPAASSLARTSFSASSSIKSHPDGSASARA